MLKAVFHLGLLILLALPSASFAPPSAPLASLKTRPAFVTSSPSFNPADATTNSFPSNFSRCTQTSSLLKAGPDDPSSSSPPSKIFFLLDPNTRGGSLAYASVLFLTPILYYVYATSTSVTKSSEEIGRDISLIFTVTTTLLWTASYLFRVVSKDMTYAKQLRDYEDAVIEKRMSELDEEEKIGLVEQIQREES